MAEAAQPETTDLSDDDDSLFDIYIAGCHKQLPPPEEFLTKCRSFGFNQSWVLEEYLKMLNKHSKTNDYMSSDEYHELLLIYARENGLEIIDKNDQKNVLRVVQEHRFQDHFCEYEDWKHGTADSVVLDDYLQNCSGCEEGDYDYEVCCHKRFANHATVPDFSEYDRTT